MGIETIHIGSWLTPDSTSWRLKKRHWLLQRAIPWYPVLFFELVATLQQYWSVFQLTYNKEQSVDVDTATASVHESLISSLPSLGSLTEIRWTTTLLVKRNSKLIIASFLPDSATVPFNCSLSTIDYFFDTARRHYQERVEPSLNSFFMELWRPFLICRQRIFSTSEYTLPKPTLSTVKKLLRVGVL